MTQFLERQGLRPDGLNDFLVWQAERLKQHARPLAQRQGRPFLVFAERVRKDETAREIAERSGSEEGLGLCPVDARAVLDVRVALG